MLSRKRIVKMNLYFITIFITSFFLKIILNLSTKHHSFGSVPINESNGIYVHIKLCTLNNSHPNTVISSIFADDVKKHRPRATYTHDQHHPITVRCEIWSSPKMCVSHIWAHKILNQISFRYMDQCLM